MHIIDSSGLRDCVRRLRLQPSEVELSKRWWQKLQTIDLFLDRKALILLPFSSHPDALEAFTYWEVRALVSARYRMSTKRFGVCRLRSW